MAARFPERPASAGAASSSGEGTPGLSRDGDAGQLALELGHTPSHALDDFVSGEGNRLALAHILNFPDWPHPVTALFGPAQAGKSHLARIWAERSGAAFALADGLDDLASAGGRRPLVVEDVERAGYDEAALFHLLNQSVREQRPMLLTARAPVAAWPFRTEDLKSRVRLATAITVAPSEDLELSQIFAKLFADRQLAVDRKVIAYLVARMERSPEEVAALADLLDRLALAHGTAVTRRIAAEALGMRRQARGASGGTLSWEGDDDE